MRSATALVLAIVLAVLGQRFLAQTPPNSVGWLLHAGGVVLAVFAFASGRREHETAEGEAAEAQKRTARTGALGLGLLALVAIIFAVFRLWQGGYRPFLAWIWAGGLLALVVAAWLWSGWTRPTGPVAAGTERADAVAATPASASNLPLWAEIALLGFILAVALFMRLYRLRQMPPGIFVDETNAAIDALHILEGRADSPFGTGWFETPTMYAYYLLALLKTVGINFTALKAASLIPALLTVAALYPLGRRLFGVPTALASTFLLAVSRWHVNMSRWGWNEVAPPLFQIASVYFLLRGARRRHLGDWALGGLLLGLGMYTYLASRLAVVAVAAYVVYRVVVQRGFLRRAWSGLVVFWAVWALTFAPLASTYVRDPFTFWNRTRQVSVFNDIERVGSYQPLYDNVEAHLKMLHVEGDTNPRHNLPGEPMLDPVMGILFLFGLVYSLWRWKDHRRGLLLVWMFFGVLGGVFSLRNEAPQAYRTLGILPAVTLIAGDALVRATRVLAAVIKPRTGRLALAGAMAGLLLVAGWWNYDVYFHEQASDLRVWQAFSPVETAVAREVAAKQHDHSLYLSHRLYFFSPLRFLTYEPVEEGGGGLEQRPYQLASPADDLPLADLSGQDALFLLDVHYEDLLELFTRYYPGTSSEMVRGPQGQPLYLSVTIPGQEIVALHGLIAEYDVEGEGPLIRRDARLDLRWPDDLPSPRVPNRIEWIGGLRVPASGVYAFRPEGGLLVELDGSPLSEGARFMGKGLHGLRVVQSAPLSSQRDVARVYWTPPGQPEETLPASALFAVRSPVGGLLGRYYRGESWEGEPVFEQVSPLILFAWPETEPWFGPFSASWSGTLEATLEGSYLFRVHADDGVRVWLDGAILGESMVPDTVNLVEASSFLSVGSHPVRVDYFQRGGGKALELWWTPPGGRHQVVPPSVLKPETD